MGLLLLPVPPQQGWIFFWSLAFNLRYRIRSSLPVYNGCRFSLAPRNSNLPYGLIGSPVVVSTSTGHSMVWGTKQKRKENEISLFNRAPNHDLPQASTVDLPADEFRASHGMRTRRRSHPSPSVVPKPFRHDGAKYESVRNC
jgi:hypothetical protein